MTTTEMTSQTSLKLPSHSFLNDAIVVQLNGPHWQSTGIGWLDPIITQCVDTRSPLIDSADDQKSHSVATLCIPVFKNGEIVSVVALLATEQLPENGAELVGVFEVWKPELPYAEVALTAGYFGKMERFSNVSSFVRFERGTGLPGQVWDRRQAVIHDDLGNHPGFLRAAGASADLLQTAVGIPVFDRDYIASVLLINSHSTPIARGFEVWGRTDDGFEMLVASYVDFASEFALQPGADSAAGDRWATEITERGGAAIVHDPVLLCTGRTTSPETCLPSSALAIPCFDGESLDSFLVLYF